MSSPLFKPSNSILKIQLNENTDIVHTTMIFTNYLR